jgi:hypothetical protein
MICTQRPPLYLFLRHQEGTVCSRNCVGMFFRIQYFSVTKDSTDHYRVSRLHLAGILDFQCKAQLETFEVFNSWSEQRNSNSCGRQSCSKTKHV